MGAHADEQKDEVEALESIYPDSFKLISSDPHCFSIDVETTETDMYEESSLSFQVTLQFTLTQDYPDEAPLYEVISSDGFPTDDGHNYIERINELINEQIEENLGMVMVFTIISSVQDFLNQVKDDLIRLTKEIKERKEREIKEREERKSHGTPVTVANFLVWKAKFDAEMAALEEKLAEKKEKKLTGKEIFLQMKVVSDDAELLEGESEAVEVDESLFSNLDDLELDDEDLE